MDAGDPMRTSDEARDTARESSRAASDDGVESFGGQESDRFPLRVGGQEAHDAEGGLRESIAKVRFDRCRRVAVSSCLGEGGRDVRQIVESGLSKVQGQAGTSQTMSKSARVYIHRSRRNAGSIRES